MLCVGYLTFILRSLKPEGRKVLNNQASGILVWCAAKLNVVLVSAWD